MKRFLPSPLISLTLLFIWLLLNQSIALEHLLLGTLLAIVIPLLSKGLIPYSVRVRQPRLIIKLMAYVLFDIIRSAIAVCGLIIFQKNKSLNSQFIHIPLQITNVHALAVLAGIINCTPGTVWVELQPGNILLLHVFDLKDEAWWHNTIKNHFEKPLLAIFISGDSHA